MKCNKDWIIIEMVAKIWDILFVLTTFIVFTVESYCCKYYDKILNEGLWQWAWGYEN